MTIRSSKKPLNNSKDASTNQQQQQQQQPTSALTRALLSHDDERSDATKPIDDSASSEDETVATLPSTTTPATGIDDAQSMVTTSPIFPNHSKRKSHYRYQHLCQTINNKQARRRGNEVDENVPTSTSSDSSNEPFTSTSWNHVAAGQEEADQCNSEDEHEHSSVKYDQNNLNEVSRSTLSSRMHSFLRILARNTIRQSVEREEGPDHQSRSRGRRLFISSRV